MPTGDPANIGADLALLARLLGESSAVNTPLYAAAAAHGVSPAVAEQINAAIRATVAQLTADLAAHATFDDPSRFDS